MSNIKNILQIDVEPWYVNMPQKEWHTKNDRLTKNISRILNILNEYKVKATFFILGYIIKKHPDIVKKIIDYGHEIASHGYSHISVYNQTPSLFKKDIEKSLGLLNKYCDTILGYRAPRFSIMEGNLWALKILQKKGFIYDSSIFPIKNFLYGVPNSPKHPFIMKEDSEFLCFLLKICSMRA